MSEIDAARFRQVLGHFPTGVTVVTAPGPDGPVGVSIGSFFSVSLEPLLVGFCVGDGSTSWPVIRDVGRFCVNILAEDQEAVSRVFATKDSDKFGIVGWVPSVATGSPRLDDVLAWIDCDLVDVHGAGDHEICVGRVRDLGVEREDGPLLFYRGGYGRCAV